MNTPSSLSPKPSSPPPPPGGSPSLTIPINMVLIYSQFQHSQMTLGFGSFQIIALIFLVVTMSYKVQSDHLGNTGQHGKKICSSCNYFQGSWVVDNHYPLYDAASCPFTKKDFNRQKNGRPADMEYLKYIWKPNSCLIPR